MNLKMINEFLIDARYVEDNNLEISLSLFSPIVVVTNRALTTSQEEVLINFQNEYRIIFLEEDFNDAIFYEKLKQPSIKVVCGDTGRILTDYFTFLENMNKKFFGNELQKELKNCLYRIEGENLSPTLKYNLSGFINLLSVTASYDERFLSKDCFFDCSEVWGRKDESYLNMLDLIDIEKIKLKYDREIFVSYICTNSLRRKKNLCLTDFQSFKNRGNHELVKVQDYPSALKLLSAFYIKAAKYKILAEVLSSSFMYAFRALETYCDGLLIHKSKAHIGNALRGNEIFKENTLLVRDKFVSGFGAKWKIIKEFDEFDCIEQAVKDDLDNIYTLRNSFVLTHGNIKITKNIVEQSIRVISDFISSYDNSIHQTTSNWTNVYLRVEEFTDLNIVEELNNYCIENQFV